MSLSVLHITAHLGGGVGTVLRALLPKLNDCDDYSHQVVSLEYANEKAKLWSTENNISINDCIYPKSEWLHSKMEQADIVHIHFWNHPALYELMSEFSGKSARIVIWAHVNGRHAPYLFNKSVLEFPELFVVSTNYSLEQDNIRQHNHLWRTKHIQSVHSSGGISGFNTILPKKHKGFRVGYVGTVDYVKMHKDFITICSEVNIDNVTFVVCGGDKEAEIQKEVEEQGVANKFTFLGQVNCVKEVLAEIDIFAYPLNRNNYGTGEQALIEAMSAGIPQIVFGGGPEEIVVKDSITGLVVNNTRDFTDAIIKLSTNHKLRKKLSENSKKYAQENYDLQCSVDSWTQIYEKIMRRDIKPCSFDFMSGPFTDSDKVVELFFLGLGRCPELSLLKKAISHYPNTMPVEIVRALTELPEIFHSETRGSVKHYGSYFKNLKLLYLSKYLNKGDI